MIEIQNLTFGYSKESIFLRLPELIIKPGEHLAILGPSGSGKSSLLRLLAGLILPISGTIIVNKNLASSPSSQDRRKLRRLHIHYLSQDGNLLTDLSVKENLLFPFHESNFLPPEGQLDLICKKLAINHLLHKLPGECSGGEQQKVSIARALISNNPYILADEPTSHLPPEAREKTLKIALEVLNEEGRTMIMVTHNKEALEMFPLKIEAPFGGEA